MNHNPQVDYCNHKNFRPVPILSQINLVNAWHMNCHPRYLWYVGLQSFIIRGCSCSEDDKLTVETSIVLADQWGDAGGSATNNANRRFINSLREKTATIGIRSVKLVCV